MILIEFCVLFLNLCFGILSWKCHSSCYLVCISAGQSQVNISRSNGDLFHQWELSLHGACRQSCCAVYHRDILQFWGSPWCRGAAGWARGHLVCASAPGGAEWCDLQGAPIRAMSLWPAASLRLFFPQQRTELWGTHERIIRDREVLHWVPWWL